MEDEDEINSVYDVKRLLYDKLLESGQMLMFKKLLQNRLLHHGWMFTMRRECIRYMQKEGPDTVNISHMTGDMMEFGLESCPEKVREEMMGFLKEFAKLHIGIDNSVILSEVGEESKIRLEYQSRDAKPDPPICLLPSTPVPLQAPPLPLPIVTLKKPETKPPSPALIPRIILKPSTKLISKQPKVAKVQASNGLSSSTVRENVSDKVEKPTLRVDKSSPSSRDSGISLSYTPAITEKPHAEHTKKLKPLSFDVKLKKEVATVAPITEHLKKSSSHSIPRVDTSVKVSQPLATTAEKKMLPIPSLTIVSSVTPLTITPKGKPAQTHMKLHTSRTKEKTKDKEKRKRDASRSKRSISPVYPLKPKSQPSHSIKRISSPSPPPIKKHTSPISVKSTSSSSSEPHISKRKSSPSRESKKTSSSSLHTSKRQTSPSYISKRSYSPEPVKKSSSLPQLEKSSPPPTKPKKRPTSPPQIKKRELSPPRSTKRRDSAPLPVTKKGSTFLSSEARRSPPPYLLSEKRKSPPREKVNRSSSPIPKRVETKAKTKLPSSVYIKPTKITTPISIKFSEFSSTKSTKSASSLPFYFKERSRSPKTILPSPTMPPFIIPTISKNSGYTESKPRVSPPPPVKEKKKRNSSPSTSKRSLSPKSTSKKASKENASKSSYSTEKVKKSTESISSYSTSSSHKSSKSKSSTSSRSDKRSSPKLSSKKDKKKHSSISPPHLSKMSLSPPYKIDRGEPLHPITKRLLTNDAFRSSSAYSVTKPYFTSLSKSPKSKERDRDYSPLSSHTLFKVSSPSSISSLGTSSKGSYSSSKTIAAIIPPIISKSSSSSSMTMISPTLATARHAIGAATAMRKGSGKGSSKGTDSFIKPAAPGSKKSSYVSGDDVFTVPKGVVPKSVASKKNSQEYSAKLGFSYGGPSGKAGSQSSAKKTSFSVSNSSKPSMSISPLSLDPSSFSTNKPSSIPGQGFRTSFAQAAAKARVSGTTTPPPGGGYDHPLNAIHVSTGGKTTVTLRPGGMGFSKNLPISKVNPVKPMHGGRSSKGGYSSYESRAEELRRRTADGIRSSNFFESAALLNLPFRGGIDGELITSATMHRKIIRARTGPLMTPILGSSLLQAVNMAVEQSEAAGKAAGEEEEDLMDV